MVRTCACSTGQVRTQVKELRSPGGTHVVSEKRKRNALYTVSANTSCFFSSIKEDEDTSDSVIVSLFIIYLGCLKYVALSEYF